MARRWAGPVEERHSARATAIILAVLIAGWHLPPSYADPDRLVLHKNPLLVDL
jgi:hypothetical protein